MKEPYPQTTFFFSNQHLTNKTVSQLYAFLTTFSFKQLLLRTLEQKHIANKLLKLLVFKDFRKFGNLLQTH